MSTTVACIVVAAVFHHAARCADPAEQAYALRMEGKLDAARVLLEKAVATSPADAAAHYELARTRMHQATGDIRNVAHHLQEADRSIRTAVQCDPKQVQYHLFAGHVAYFRTYLAVQMQQQATLREHFAAACDAYQAALARQPSCRSAQLYLVELHASFPETCGADRDKARQYAEQLAAAGDPWLGKARSILRPDFAAVTYWEDLLAQGTARDAAVLEELGKAYLRADRVADARRTLEKAIQLQPEKAYLYLDLSIYHTFRAMQAGDNEEVRQDNLLRGDAAVRSYLAMHPSRPMQAYALGVQSKYQRFLGNAAEADKLFKRALELDPYFSKATGLPSPALFIGPREVPDQHRYLMRPF